MDEYIKKSKIIDLLTEQRQFYENERKASGDYDEINMLCGSDNALVAIEDAISDIETEDVAPVAHAKFVYKLDGTVCSKCGKKPMMQTDNEGYFLMNPKYCPHCGARFDLKTFE